jgi:hypothetical protein
VHLGVYLTMVEYLALIPELENTGLKLHVVVLLAEGHMHHHQF